MIDKETRIKIAIQKSGRLTDHSLDLLQRCGLKYTRARDQLICFGENMPLDILLVRDDDIPALVRDDVCDLGVVGLNIVEEARLGFDDRDAGEPFSDLPAPGLRPLPAVLWLPGRGPVQSVADLQGQRIATSYPNMVDGLPPPRRH